MTLEAWVYPTVPMSSWMTVLLKESSRGLAYSLYANSDKGKPSNTINTGDANRELSAGPELPVNTWTHVAATYDGSSAAALRERLSCRRPASTGVIVVH